MTEVLSRAVHGDLSGAVQTAGTSNVQLSLEREVTAPSGFHYDPEVTMKNRS